MQNLNPTLWRTCRMLAGTTRIRLIRAIHEHPGQSVRQLADLAGIGLSDASQELRRIQSRGLLRSSRNGVCLIYRMEPDPQVASAAPLLKALKTALSTLPAEQDADICRIAFGPAYPRRIALLQVLAAIPKSGLALSRELQWSTFATYSHLQILHECGWIQRVNRQWMISPPDHPLASALARLLKSTPA